VVAEKPAGVMRSEQSGELGRILAVIRDGLDAEGPAA
jgi:hypothetical protein